MNVNKPEEGVHVKIEVNENEIKISGRLRLTLSGEGFSLVPGDQTVNECGQLEKTYKIQLHGKNIGFVIDTKPNKNDMFHGRIRPPILVHINQILLETALQEVQL